ncbi:acetylglutamate kinase [Lewinella marina]|uniref:Acetylglutamate kinase n=1 Tax=Neolewinella marina TaxID=438751 RepID=A0A2G0CCL9_9BACT|nr:acetylglutamate kinase [Neolewinella marina]NJB87586.1 acetylglutamate kinase [Neolewinella marina]PHK97723.1 acetylglutamate kinase [Neolewinella marina]
MIVYKIGGNVINNPATLHEALDYVAAQVEPAILVHGGGRRANQLITEMGRQPVMVDGRRVTDHATLEIVTMVYAGSINKDIVAQLQARGSNAIGLSGADGNAILARKRPVGAIDYGFAGDVLGVNAPLLDGLLRLGLRPVLCPITHDAHGQLLNTNADTIANEVAKAMAALEHDVSLQYCFELPGVLRDINDHDSVIRTLNPDSYAAYREEGVISAGMIPKLDNAFAAIAAGVREVVIGSLSALRAGEGTRIHGA